LLLTKRDFEKLLLEAVDEGLSSLGESSKQAIYFHLDKSFNIQKGEIPDKIGMFTNAIENIFGFGANFLEILIMERLHEKISHNVKWHVTKDLTFADYITAAKRSFQDRAVEVEEGLIECDEPIQG
jgi:hypothetical protein